MKNGMKRTIGLAVCVILVFTIFSALPIGADEKSAQVEVEETADQEEPIIVQMDLWEAWAKGYATVTCTDDYIGHLVEVSESCPGPVSIDEEAMLMSPSPAYPWEDGQDNDETQDGALTAGHLINPGESLRYNYGLFVAYEIFDPPAWWCTEDSELTLAGTEISLGGEILPDALSSMVSETTKDAQNELWAYLRENPSLVVGKTPLWTQVELPSTTGVHVKIAVTNIGFECVDDAVVIDTIPSGGEASDFTVAPDVVIENPDGSKTLKWFMDFAGAVETPHDEPTDYDSQYIEYELSLFWSTGRYDLPRAEVDLDGDGATDARSAEPLVEVTNLIEEAILTKETTVLKDAYNIGIKSLYVKLEHVDEHLERALDWYSQGRYQNALNELNAAENVLDAFISEVNAQDGKRLTEEQAALLLKGADAVRQYIEAAIAGCE